MKLLLTIHVLMGDVKHGRLFVQQFLNWAGWPGQKDEQDLLSKFVNIHTIIIQKLTLISEVVSRSKLKTNINLLCTRSFEFSQGHRRVGIAVLQNDKLPELYLCSIRCKMDQ